MADVIESPKPDTTKTMPTANDTKPRVNGIKPVQRTYSIVDQDGVPSELVTGPSPRRKAIRWAPLVIPIRRRLETLVVVIFQLAGLIALAMFWFTAANPLTWPLLVPYLIYLTLTPPPSDKPPSNFLSSIIRNKKFWSYFCTYFPMRLHRSVELSPEENYIFGFHPHGIISHGAWGSFVTKTTGWDELFPGISNTLLTLESNFRLPFYREYLIGMGLGSVSRKSCEGLLGGVPGEVSEADVHLTIWDRAPKVFRKRKGFVSGSATPLAASTTVMNGTQPNGRIVLDGEKPAMKKGQGITIVIGGAQESLFAKPGNMTLKMRKGFLRVAVRTGAHLVPVLSFGENDLFDQLIPEKTSWVHKFQILVKKVFGFTIPLFHARGIFNYDVGLVPYRVPVNTVVGRPIKTIQSPDPRDDYIDELQDLYCEELERLWEEHKDKFAPRRRAEMRIIR
ncbi:diacylglycerol O-acyltransferase 1 [Orbilia oligospora]|nr:diacylglycerol O-acyltransferase 1 [Orbilia oligospora]KAF3252737.1 diacylglycerol O-acyltransferase 1 [Orbilia oligospora]KAF3252738.1 diacylglycerol O-acyltransferase 1, variant 2 [Orbilia oligospora]KAF3252844.1 diacylglycerol O-acyltransferase 1 [Orbilia oligospora]